LLIFLPLAIPPYHPAALNPLARDCKLWGCQESKGLGAELRSGVEDPRLALDSLYIFFTFSYFFFYHLSLSLSVLAFSLSLSLSL
jgi:hypothetical protein